MLAMNITKSVIEIGTSATAGYVVGMVINAAIPETISTAGRVAVVVGTGAIGGYLGNKVGQHWANEFETTVNNVKKAFKKPGTIKETFKKVEEV